MLARSVVVGGPASLVLQQSDQAIMGGPVDDRGPRSLTEDLAVVLAQARDSRRDQHASDHGSLPSDRGSCLASVLARLRAAAARGLDPSLVPVHRDAPQGLASEYSR